MAQHFYVRRPFVRTTRMLLRCKPFPRSRTGCLSYIPILTQQEKSGNRHPTQAPNKDSPFLPLARRPRGLLARMVNAGKALAEELKARGLEATFMAGYELDLARPGVKVLTLKSSKGLEFPIVALAGFLGGA